MPRSRRPHSQLTHRFFTQTPNETLVAPDLELPAVAPYFPQAEVLNFEGPPHVTDHEELSKEQQRLERKRLSAQKSRMRKRQECTYLREKNAALKELHKNDQVINENLFAQQIENQAIIAELQQKQAPLIEKIERLKGKKKMLTQQNSLFFELLQPFVNAAASSATDDVITTPNTPRIGGQ